MRHTTRRIAFFFSFTLCLAVLSNLAQAQTLTVLHTFNGGPYGTDPMDGAFPEAGVVQDGAGNLYGTTSSGGVGPCEVGGCGVVYKLSHRGTGWVTTTIYTFKGPPDGAGPNARLTFGPDGELYGTTTGGGTGSCIEGQCGTVFKLQPPPTFCRTASCPWSETVIHDFSSDPDGSQPYAEVVFDQAGNLYGTTSAGGACCGIVFELTPGSNGTWTKSTLYQFQGGSGDGKEPKAGLVFDQAGNLYGSTYLGGGTGCGGAGCGTLFELSPSGSGWTETILHSFTGGEDGADPSSLTFDSEGNLWGAVVDYPLSNGYGAILELTPAQGGGWNFTEPIVFTSNSLIQYPQAPALDAAGNLYGTGFSGSGAIYGAPYKATPSGSGWNFEVIGFFTQGGPQGYVPVGRVVLNGQGSFYGVCMGGPLPGADAGAVWEATP
jgi:uncharacterized repeat protein (TIGR03803 family)